MTRFNYNLGDDGNTEFAKGINSHLPSRRRGKATAVPAGTTFIVSNFPAFAHAAVVGTGAASNADSPGGAFINSLTSAAAGDSSTVVTATVATRRDWNPWIRFNFCAGNNIASVRWWIGAFASDPSALSTISSISGACFGYDTQVDGTAFWRCETGNASTATKKTTTIPVVANTSYTAEIRMDTANAKIDFYMASHGLLTAVKTQMPLTLVASLASSVPVAATPLLLGATTTVLNTAAAAKRIVMGSVEISQD